MTMRESLSLYLRTFPGWDRLRIRQFFESYGVMIQEWDHVRTDWLTLRPLAVETEAAAAPIGPTL